MEEEKKEVVEHGSNQVDNFAEEPEKKPFDVQAMLAELDASIARFKAKGKELNDALADRMSSKAKMTQEDFQPYVD